MDNLINQKSMLQRRMSANQRQVNDVEHQRRVGGFKFKKQEKPTSVKTIRARFETLQQKNSTTQLQLQYGLDFPAAMKQKENQILQMYAEPEDWQSKPNIVHNNDSFTTHQQRNYGLDNSIRNMYSNRHEITHTQINDQQVLRDSSTQKLINHFNKGNRPMTAQIKKIQKFTSNRSDEFGDTHLKSDEGVKQPSELDFLIKKIQFKQKPEEQFLSGKVDSSFDQLETLTDKMLGLKKLSQGVIPAQITDRDAQAKPQIDVVKIDNAKFVRSSSQRVTNRPMTTTTVRGQIRMQSLTKTKEGDKKSADDNIDLNGINRYIIQHVLGTGSYASVKLARDRLTDQKVAIKTYLKSRMCDAQKRQSLRREIFILKKLDHEGIIKLFNTIDTIQEYHLIMEYGGTVSLRQYVKSTGDRKLPEAEAKIFFRQIVRAIEYCHKNNVVHRDIKMENILLNERQDVKLIDFGFGVMTHVDTKLSVFCGTPCYMAPEIVARQDYLGRSADVWSLGVLLYAMVTGQFPFKGKDDKELFQAIKSGKYKQPRCGVQCQKLISQLLRIRPNERPDALQVILYCIYLQQILQDSWFHM